MITRVVPSIKGQGDSAGYELAGFQGRVRPPEDILRQARATSITGVLGQIASVASYALDILQELKNETTEVQDRMTKLHQRVDVLAEVVDSQIRRHYSGGRSEDDLMLPSKEESDRILCMQTISSSVGEDNKAGRPDAILAAYEQCEGIPPLELLDSFYGSDLRNGSENQTKDHLAGSGSISRKKYSNPGFFMEEWLKNEEGRQQRALEIKEERRRGRQQALNRRELDQQRHTTSTEETKSSSSCDDAEQKLKFLKIRSWKEIYGTGEGKELMKQQTGRSPSLRDLRKKAHQSLVSITHSPPRTDKKEERQPVSPPPPPPPPEEPNHQSDQFATAPPDPSSVPTALGGAFMQEMDDDEVAMAMQLEEEFTNGIPPPPPLPLTASPEEFTDHGLSYYYDPTATHNLTPPPPPPPPPPELDEQSKFDAYYDAYDEEDESIPPPPIEEFVPPPPPPEPDLPSGRSLLEEIQLGKPLRRAKDRQPQREAPVQPLSPQAALLQQILQKQTRALRPVEPRARPPLQTRQSTGAPFADSIARILERRSMIAYDSDSDKSNTSDKNDDDDW
ncbi:hypothetical protein V7S43_004769 [Phytophthora oleae]|uniref:WH2 domain-containing protein n=1 Tax=Phytophthora oleae TaxID=2107226 RepID=A0ABD3FXH8_9STRA